MVHAINQGPMLYGGLFSVVYRLYMCMEYKHNLLKLFYFPFFIIFIVRGSFGKHRLFDLPRMKAPLSPFQLSTDRNCEPFFFFFFFIIAQFCDFEMCDDSNYPFKKKVKEFHSLLECKISLTRCHLQKDILSELIFKSVKKQCIIFGTVQIFTTISQVSFQL